MTWPTTDGILRLGQGAEAGDLRRNREVWSQVNDQFTGSDAEHRWRSDGLEWGLFRIPEDELGALGPVEGIDVIELGCGTAFVSAQLARRGARPVAVDLSPEQLRVARSCQRRFGPSFPLVECSATGSASCGGPGSRSRRCTSCGPHRRR